MPEKWFDRVYPMVQQDISEKEAQSFREHFNPEVFHDPFRAKEYRKNEFERRAIKIINRILEKFFASLELPVYQVSEDQVHVMSENNLRVIHSDPESPAVTIYRHIYILRNSNRIFFIHDLTHEVAHAMGHTQLYVVVQDREAKRVQLNVRQSGFHFLGTQKSSEQYFAGLDEAGVEMMAHEMRQILVDNIPLLKPEENEELVHRWVYLPQVLLMEDLLNSLTDDPEESEKIWKEFFRDRILGTYSVIRKLEKRKKGTSAILRKMGRNPEDAIEARKLLGL